MKRKLLRIIRWGIIIFFLLSFIVILLSYKAIQQHLSRKIYSAKNIVRIKEGKAYFESLNAEPVSIKTDDNITLSGLLIPAQYPKRVIMMCHGLHATKELMSNCVRALYNDTTSFFLFDFRAHGESRGLLTSFGHHEKKDIAAVIKFLTSDERTKKLPLYGIGISMGGAILMAGASEIPQFKGLIIDSSFLDLEEQIKRSYQIRTNLPAFPFLIVSSYLLELIHGMSLTQLSPRQYLHLIDVPMLFIHSQDDQIVPVSEAELLYNGKQFHKQLWVVKSAKHGHICKLYSQEYRQKVYEFIDSIEHKKFMNDEKVTVQATDPSVKPIIPSTPEYARTVPTRYNQTPPERPWETAFSERMQIHLDEVQNLKQQKAIEKRLGISSVPAPEKPALSNEPEKQIIVQQPTSVPQTDTQPLYEVLGIPEGQARYLESLVQEREETE